MKRILLLILIAFSVQCQAQLLNGGLENWTNSSDFDHPNVDDNVFISSNFETFFEDGVISCYEVPGVDGSGMRIESTEVSGQPAAGFAIWGNPPGDGDDLIFTDGFDFSDENVTALNVDMRYNINPLSPGLVIVQFFFEGVPAGPGTIGPGTYAFEVSGEQLTFQTMTFDIDPAIGTAIDQCALAFASNNAADDMAEIFVGDFMEIDNVSFSGTMQTIPGGDLDTWELALPVETPDEWQVFSNPFFTFVEKTEDAVEGNFAAKLSTLDIEGEPNPAILAQGDLVDQFLPNIPVEDNFYGVRFDHKYIWETTDTAAVFVVMAATENPDPDDVWFDLEFITEQTDWTEFIVDLSDITEFVNVNYIGLAFVSSFENDGVVGGNMPQVNSMLYVDDVQLLYEDTDVCDFDVNIAQGDEAIICPDEPFTLNVEDTYDSYQWYREPFLGGPAEELVGETNSTLEINAAQYSLYYVWCEATFEGCTEESNTIFIDSWVFAPTVIASQETDICEGESATLEALGAAGSVQWYLDGVAIEGATSSIYEATESGGYTVSIFPAQCPNFELNNGVPVNINVNPNPTPEIEQGLGTFLSVTGGPYASYEWYQDGVLLEGPEFEGESIDAGDGNYYVVVTDLNGCTGQSEENFYSNIDEASARIFKVYPTPTTSVVTIETGQSGSYNLMDLSGRMAQSGYLRAGKNQLDLSELSNGMYFISIDGYTARVVKK